ncbi:SpoVR family protein [bacterium]|nr:SpoVR family protein [bacterium]
MELLNGATKKIMEECKAISRDQGLQFRDETLEFMITNEDMIKLNPKGMIPTLYDYWVHDVFVLQDKGKYDVSPGNPYETVINTRPPISFYNDNNPDWLNVMIFYHVIAHIDFFQNNVFFKKTWLDDFLGKALSDAQIIKELRLEKGRWVDYVIEFSRGIDNLVNFYSHLFEGEIHYSSFSAQSKVDFFFDEYLQKILDVTTFRFLEELEKFNEFKRIHNEETAQNLFLLYVEKKYLDFNVKFEKRLKKQKPVSSDVLQFMLENSSKLKKDENEWIKPILQIVRETSMYFQPQIRTKILNEGWASYWHEKLFLLDPRMKTHEIEFSKINSFVVSLPRVGMNPYAVGLRLFKFLEAKADRGMLTFEYENLSDVAARSKFDRKTGAGLKFIFNVRKFHSDSTAVNEFVDQDFVNEFKLFVTGRQINRERGVWEYFIKSRKADDFKRQLSASLYHPPSVVVDKSRTESGEALYLVHNFEGKELVREYIQNTMLGIEFLWGNKVILETHEIDESLLKKEKQEDFDSLLKEEKEIELKFQKVVYTMENKKLSRQAFKEYINNYAK